MSGCNGAEETRWKNALQRCDEAKRRPACHEVFLALATRAS